MIEVFTDGACINQHPGCGGDIFVGVVIMEDKKIIRRIGIPHGKGDSTISEYVGIIAGLNSLPEGIKSEEIVLYCDNKSICDKITKYIPEYINMETIKHFEPNNQYILDIVKFFRTGMNLTIKWIDRGQNMLAHNLANNASKGICEDMVDVAKSFETVNARKTDNFYLFQKYYELEYQVQILYNELYELKAKNENSVGLYILDNKVPLA